MAANDIGRKSAETEENGTIREVGVILLTSSHETLAYDQGAADILNNSTQRSPSQTLGIRVPREILDTIRRIRPGDPSPVRTRFECGGRDYMCSAYLMKSATESFPSYSIAIHLERDLSTSENLASVIDEYHLTGREQEVLRGIAAGLTSKEVANRMNISPNTVKAFLRLIMIKMGVTTRSGIVGKLLEQSGGRHGSESRMSAP